MRIVSWRGWEPKDDHLWIGLTDSVRGAWNPSIATQSRSGTTSVVTEITIEGRPIECEFGNDPASAPTRTIEETHALGLQRLNPLDTSEGELVVERNDNSTWSCMARITLPGSVVDGTVDTFDVVWFTTDPLWHSTDTVTETGVLTPSAIPNPSFVTNTNGWTMGALPANVTASFTRDASVFYGVAGSGRVQVTANSGSGGTWYVMNDAEFPCAEGDIINVAAWVQTTNDWDAISETGLAVEPVVQFFTSADAYISETSAWYTAQPANVWERAYTGAVPWPAPATVDYCKIGARITAHASQTGSVYFDDFGFPDAPDGSATPFEVEGNAPTHLKLIATPAGSFPQSIYARQFTITNSGDQVWIRQPIWVDLGDNTAGQTTGQYWALLRDGRMQHCHITDYDSRKAMLLLVVDYLPAGQSADYTLLVSDQTVLPGINFQFNSYTAPAFDHGHFYGTASGGGHSTTVTNTSGLGSENNRWDEGVIIGLTGANAGIVNRISASTATQLTHGAFPQAFSNGNEFMILMSHNGIVAGQANWTYPVQRTNRSDNVTRGRGLWWLESGQIRPHNYRSDVPAAWRPDLALNNSDQFNQKWVTPNDFGGGDIDFFAILDANRTWQGGSDLKDEGGYDGVGIDSPWDILTFRLDYQLKNPNSMAKLAVLSQRLGGALEMLEEFTDAAPLTDLTDRNEQTLTLTPQTRHLGVHLLPNMGDEIGAGWAGAQGQATSATTTTLVDASMDGEWTSGQFNGGWIEIKTGLGAGQRVAITGTNANGTITVASWPGGQPDNTSRYVIRNRSYVATARSRTTWRLSLSTASLGISAVSAETPAFVLYRDILLNAVDGLGVETEIQRVQINPETTGRYIVLLADESLVVDGETMRAWVADASSGDEIRRVPPQAYSVLTVDQDGTRRAAPHWLQVSPGDYSVTLASDEPGVACAVDVEFREAIYS